MFLEAVRSMMERYRMVREGDRILVGVSGGPDSLALLGALVALKNRYHFSLWAVYVDHGLRPREVRRESGLVKKITQVWGVPIEIFRRPVRRKGGESLEQAARRERYQAFLQAARRHRCTGIALGHTADDQAETVLMWILRGTGTAGLAGIPPVRPLQGTGKVIRVIRPLLGCSRSDVEGFLKAHRIQPVQDSSNKSSRFLRNRIRLELIPLLERRYNAGIRRHLSGLAGILREDLEWLKACIQKEFRVSARRRKKTEITLTCRRSATLPSSLRRGLLRMAVEVLQGDCQGFAMRHWQMLDQMLLDGRKSSLDLPHGFHAQIVGSGARAVLQIRALVKFEPPRL